MIFNEEFFAKDLLASIHKRGKLNTHLNDIDPSNPKDLIYPIDLTCLLPPSSSDIHIYIKTEISSLLEPSRCLPLRNIAFTKVKECTVHTARTYNSSNDKVVIFQRGNGGRMELLNGI